MRTPPGEWTELFDNVTLTLSEFGCVGDESDDRRILDEVARVLRGT